MARRRMLSLLGLALAVAGSDPPERDAMRPLLVLSAGGEAVTGLLLLADPQLVGRLLFGGKIVGAGMVMSRIAGISLIALGVACWPRRDAENSAPRALPALLTYSLPVTAYLAAVGIDGQTVGRLLWPAAAGHAALTILLARAWLGGGRIGWWKR